MSTITKRTVPAALFIVSQLLLGTSCGKGSLIGCGQNSGYSFLATAQWSPQKESYKVGDTLYLTSTIPKTLTDQINTSMVIDYSNSEGIGGNITFFELDSVSHQVVDAAAKFNALASAGQVSAHAEKPQRLKAFLYDEGTTHYRLLIKVIPYQKGIFTFFVSELLSTGIKNKNCTKAGFNMTIVNTDKHTSLYQNAIQQTPDEIQKKTIYCFRVN